MAALLPSDELIDDFLARIDPPQRAEDTRLLVPLFQEVSGYRPRIWAGTMVGFGQYAYAYPSGQTGESFATGFAPRKQEIVVFIQPASSRAGELLARLGPHRLGKSCLYLRKLDKVDLGVLRMMVREGLDDLAARWNVMPS